MAGGPVPRAFAMTPARDARAELGWTVAARLPSGRLAWMRSVASEGRFALQLILPAVLTCLIFQLYPILKGVGTSLYRFGVATPVPTFVGLGNYAAVVRDAIFVAVVIPNTLLFTVCTVGIEAVLGVGI